jgi:hypothetical protein
MELVYLARLSHVLQFCGTLREKDQAGLNKSKIAK